jgi:hypothetical protein
MKKTTLLIILSTFAMVAKAQTTNKAITENDTTVKTKDDFIKKTIITPAEKAVTTTPDWTVLAASITNQYDVVTADRTITKAKIYYYYKKDWPQFCAGIVHYTNTYELATDYKKLNDNAQMILQMSGDNAELVQAQRWAKLARDGDSDNAVYKATYQEITDKLSDDN